jgi:hypothetical protein
MKRETKEAEQDHSHISSSLSIGSSSFDSLVINDYSSPRKEAKRI